MDQLIGYLLDSLERNNLLSNMNIILVSDHGMVRSNNTPFSIQNYVDESLIDLNRSVISFVSNIYPRDMSQLTQLYTALQNVPNSSVFYKNEVPARYHYSNNDRIGKYQEIGLKKCCCFLFFYGFKRSVSTYYR